MELGSNFYLWSLVIPILLAVAGIVQFYLTLRGDAGPHDPVSDDELSTRVHEGVGLIADGVLQEHATCNGSHRVFYGIDASDGRVARIEAGRDDTGADTISVTPISE